MSPDGKNVYVTGLNSSSVAEFTRNTNGSLTQLGCIGWTGATGECSTNVAGMNQPSAVSVSPDGKNVYVLGRQSSAIVEFARDQSTGALTSLGCIQGLGGTECGTTGPGIGHPDGIVITADGANAYVASSRDPGFVAEFSRNSDGTLTQLAAPNDCIEGVNDPNPTQCGTTDAVGLNGATAIVEGTGASDNVYVGSVDQLGSIAEFARNVDGSLTQLTGVNACIGESGGVSCGSNVANGLMFVDSLAASSDGQNLYSAANDDRGTIAEFSRDGTGALTPLAGGNECIEGSVAFSSQPTQCTTAGVGLAASFAIALSPDDANAYVAAASGDAIVELVRNSDGSLSQLAAPDGCAGQSSCGTAANGLVEPLALAVSPDGANVYAGTFPGGFTGAVASFARDNAPVATAYVVDTTADAGDAHPGDGVCADAGGHCSLRAAVEESNASCGGLSITLPTGTYTLTGGALVIRCSTAIIGAGARTTTVTRSGAAARIFEIASGTVTISGVTITGGLANGHDVEDNPGVGGGIWIDNAGHVSIVESVIAGNQASVSGGGIDNDGQLTVEQSTINGNSAPGSSFGIGGGIDDFGSSLTVIDSTIAFNTAGTNGGGIYTASDTTLAGDTIASNTGGGYFRSGLANGQTLLNTIVAGNSPVDCGATSPTSVGHNLSSDSTCGFTASGDLAGTDPLLGALANNGGPTDTMLPANGSAAIDGGADTGCPNVDQRGVSRPQGAHCDIGALELAPAAPVVADAGTSTVSASPSSVPADGSSTSTITVTLKDTGGSPLSGKTVTLTAGSGSSAISGGGTTNGSGVVTFTVHDGTAQSVTYTAHDTTDSVDVTQTAAVTFTAIGGGGGSPPVTHALTLLVAGGGSVSSASPSITCPSTCAGIYPNGTSVTLTATTLAGYTFTGWAGDCSGTSSTCTVSLSSDRLVEAFFAGAGPPPQRTLAVAVAGGGTVTSSPAGVHCNATCSTQFDSTSTGHPDRGSRFGEGLQRVDG